MDYNARYYSPRLGRFVSPDSVVPEPGGSQGWNRYMYVKGNPMRFTDPTGHFSDDEIMTSLIGQYGDEEANKLFDLWKKDEGFMEALHQAEPNSQVWASEMNNGFGVFRQDSETGRLSVE